MPNDSSRESRNRAIKRNQSKRGSAVMVRLAVCVRMLVS
jgi:hypothetical protein